MQCLDRSCTNESFQELTPIAFRVVDSTHLIATRPIAIKMAMLQFDDRAGVGSCNLAPRVVFHIRLTPRRYCRDSPRRYKLVNRNRKAIPFSVLCRNLMEPTILAGFDFLPDRSPAAVVAVEMWEPAFCAGFQAPGKGLPSGWELPRFPPGASFP